MTHELDRQRIDARLAGVLARGERRQLAIERPRQVLVDFANFGRDQMEVVEQPFGRRRDELPLADVLGERAIGLAERARVVVKARKNIPGFPARTRIDREGAGQRQSTLLEPLNAEQFIAERFFEGTRAAPPPQAGSFTHSAEHFYKARAIAEFNRRLSGTWHARPKLPRIRVFAVL